MSSESLIEENGSDLARRMLGLYTRMTLWYLLGVVIANALGVESIYGTLTPFYGHFAPAAHLITVPVIAACVGILGLTVIRRRVLPGYRGRVAIVVTGLILIFTVLLSLAAIRLGPANGFDGRTLSAGFGNDLLWEILPIVVMLVASVIAIRWLRNGNWFETQPDDKSSRRWIIGLVLFSIIFAATVAMIRSGPDAIAKPYERNGYEYIDDIGKGLSIHGLFRDYVKIHPYLSMHAKVHPPGPIVLLWILSYIVGRTPQALAVATIVAGSLGVIPLFLWVRDMTTPRIALTCCMIYALIPTIVMFTATSADILFTPLTLLTLLFFWRAIHRNSMRYALGAGAMYAVISLSSFSLLTIGAFFGLVGLWRLADPKMRVAVIKTAVLMLLAFIGVHAAVRLWSGFDVIACFRACQQQFQEDQANLDIVTPRYAAWVYHLLNPITLIFFAGIPVTVLSVWRIYRPEPDSKVLNAICFVTLLVLVFLYLGRGEGERSAMYVMPFFAIPAAHLLDSLGARTRSLAPLAATLGFLAVQCWLMESFLYTFW